MADYVVADYVVEVYHSFDEIDNTQFRRVIERGFRKKLTVDYEKTATPQYIAVCKFSPDKDAATIPLGFAKDDYLGVAVVEKWKESKRRESSGNKDDIYYLDKIVVIPEYQHNGVAKALWSEIQKRSPCVFWRARIDNVIANKSYEKHCEQRAQQGEWFIYSKAIGDAAFQECIGYAAKKAKTVV